MKQLFETKTHGGKRFGAGRPATGRSKKNIYVTDHELDILKNILSQYRNGNLNYTTLDAQTDLDIKWTEEVNTLKSAIGVKELETEPL